MYFLMYGTSTYVYYNTVFLFFLFFPNIFYKLSSVFRYNIMIESEELKHGTGTGTVQLLVRYGIVE